MPTFTIACMACAQPAHPTDAFCSACGQAIARPVSPAPETGFVPLRFPADATSPRPRRRSRRRAWQFWKPRHFSLYR